MCQSFGHQPKQEDLEHGEYLEYCPTPRRLNGLKQVGPDTSKLVYGQSVFGVTRKQRIGEIYKVFYIYLYMPKTTDMYGLPYLYLLLSNNHYTLAPFPSAFDAISPAITHLAFITEIISASYLDQYFLSDIFAIVSELPNILLL